MQAAGNDEAKQVKVAYELALARAPKSEEVEMVKRFFAEHSKIVKERVLEEELVSLPAGFPEGGDNVAGATLVDFCHALLNSNENAATRMLPNRSAGLAAMPARLGQAAIADAVVEKARRVLAKYARASSAQGIRFEEPRFNP